MSETFVDFKQIKQQVSMEAILDRYNVRTRRVNQNSIRGACPLPSHSSDKSKESFIVQTAKNIWACQSSSCVAGRNGKKGGNILDFVAFMESCSIRDAAIRLNEWFSVIKGIEQSEKGSGVNPPPISRTDDEGENKPLTFSLSGIDHAHEYMHRRGVKKESAEYFGVGYFSGKGSMSGRVVIPIHNEKRELVAYAGRVVDDAEPKYKLPAGFKKSAVLYNLHRVVVGDYVIVVEGFFDCIRVHQAGFENVVALMGSSLSEQQQKLLNGFSDVALFLDGDEAGREATKEIAGRLVSSHWVRTFSLDAGVQPDELSSEQIRKVLAPIFE